MPPHSRTTQTTKTQKTEQSKSVHSVQKETAQEFRPESAPEGLVRMTRSLQATIGNAALQRLLQSGSIPGIQRLTVHNTEWDKANHAKRVAGEGVNVVLFIGDKRGPEIVVKGQKSGAAELQFATQLYEMVGVETPDTRIVLRDDPEGNTILERLSKLLKKGKFKDGTSKTLNLLKDAGLFMLMEKKSVSSLESFSKELDQGQQRKTDNQSFDTVFRRMFHGGFFRQLGRIHATDMFLGNNDRLGPRRQQVQNIFVSLDTGMAVGMDLMVLAASLENVKTTWGSRSNKQIEAIEENQYKDWVQYAIEGGRSKRQVRQIQNGEETIVQQDINTLGLQDEAPPFSHIINEEALKQIIDALKERLIHNMGNVHDQVEGQRRIETINSKNWEKAKNDFVVGVMEGISQISKEMGNGKLRRSYETSTQKFGKENSFDFIVFQIRHMYWKTKQEHEHIPEDMLREMLEQYAKHLVTGEGENPFENFLDLPQEEQSSFTLLEENV